VFFLENESVVWEWRLENGKARNGQQGRAGMRVMMLLEEEKGRLEIRSELKWIPEPGWAIRS